MGMSGRWSTFLRYALPLRGGVSGPTLPEFERAFAEAIGVSFALGFWKGRVAFYAALRGLGLKQGDEIILPAYTCMVVPAAAARLGVIPKYVDIEPVYCTLDPGGLPRALSSRTKAIMIQHTYGWPSAGLESVRTFAAEHGLALIEDCCHALGTRVAGRHAGAWGNVGFFSTQWSKPLTTGLGGIMVTDDHRLYESVDACRASEARLPGRWSVTQLAWQGLAYEALVFPRTAAVARNAYRWLGSRSLVIGSTSAAEYDAPGDGYFRTMSQLQAAAGLAGLRRLPQLIAHRRALSDYYHDALGDSGWGLPPRPADSEVTLLRYPIRVADKPSILALSDKHGVELGDWFVRPLHSHLADQERYGYRTGMCPNADRAAAEIVNLPLHARVSQRAARRVVEFVLENCRPPT